MCHLCRDFVFLFFIVFVVRCRCCCAFFTVFVAVGNALGRNDESVTSGEISVFTSLKSCSRCCLFRRDERTIGLRKVKLFSAVD